jgi:hypothetical protein
MSYFISKSLFKVLFLSTNRVKDQLSKFSSGERFGPGVPSACYAQIYLSVRVKLCLDQTGAASVGVSWNKICCGCAVTVAIHILEDSPSNPPICAQDTNQVSLWMDQGIICNETEYRLDLHKPMVALTLNFIYYLCTGNLKPLTGTVIIGCENTNRT